MAFLNSSLLVQFYYSDPLYTNFREKAFPIHLSQKSWWVFPKLCCWNGTKCYNDSMSNNRCEIEIDVFTFVTAQTLNGWLN